MSTQVQQIITSHSKQLLLTVASLNGGTINSDAVSLVKDAFERLVPYIKDETQSLYIRDIPDLTIDGKYPGGHCYNRHEAMIAVPAWPAKDEQLKASINHELHHMARWQNVGYGYTLGGALLSEGIATFYEQKNSGWTPPWSQAKVTNEAISAAIKDFDSDGYDHGEWFFTGPHGKWSGYGIGYQLAQKLFQNEFDTKKSLNISAGEVKALLKELN